MGHALRKYYFRITLSHGHVTEWYEIAYDIFTAHEMMIRFLNDRGLRADIVEFLKSEVIIL